MGCEIGLQYVARRSQCELMLPPPNELPKYRPLSTVLVL